MNSSGPFHHDRVFSCSCVTSGPGSRRVIELNTSPTMLSSCAADTAYPSSESPWTNPSIVRR